MAKTKKTTTAKKTTRRKPTSAKESPRTAKKSTARSTAKPTTRAAKEARTTKVTAKKKTAGETEVTMDRRKSDRRTKSEPAAVGQRKLERREKVTRRRQIDPTTCERDYSDDEVEFMNAIDNYKRASGRMFPTCSEILEVIRKLGYAKLPAIQADSSAVSETTSQEPSIPDSSVSADEVGDESVDEDIFAAEELLV